MTGSTDFDLIDPPDPELDDRIRRGLHERADGIDVNSSWDDLRAEMVASSNHRPGRRPAVLVLAAAAVVVVLIGTVVARRGSSDVAIVPAAPGTPASSLVGIDGRDLVELNPDGTAVRTIAAGPFRGVPVVSPTDHTVYVEKLVPGTAESPTCTPDDEVLGEIVAVPWSGGQPEIAVTYGTGPAISPDGRRLAYLAGRYDECHVPPAERFAHVLDLDSRQITPLGFLSAVVGRVERVGPTAWIADDVLAVALTSGHSCPAGVVGDPGASRTRCSFSFLQTYRLGGNEVESQTVGTAPADHRDATARTAPVELADAFQLPLVDAMVAARDGSLIVATVEDERTLVLRRVTLTGGGHTEDLARYTPDQFDAGSFLTVGDVVTMSQDPGSDRLALAIRDAEAIADRWHSATGPPSDLRPLGTPATWPAWVPAG